MLEYTTEEAKTLLEEKISTAEKSLNNIKEDLEFLRNQITTMEVSILFIDQKKKKKNFFFFFFFLILYL